MFSFFLLNRLRYKGDKPGAAGLSESRFLLFPGFVLRGLQALPEIRHPRSYLHRQQGQDFQGFRALQYLECRVYEFLEKAGVSRSWLPHLSVLSQSTVSYLSSYVYQDVKVCPALILRVPSCCLISLNLKSSLDYASLLNGFRGRRRVIYFYILLILITCCNCAATYLSFICLQPVSSRDRNSIFHI